MTPNKSSTPPWLLAAFAVASAAAIACQTYDFQPVHPLALSHTSQPQTVTAKGLPPEFMILVDRSASMDYAVYPGGPKRLDQLKQTMAAFLGNPEYGTLARFGVVPYRSSAGQSCDPATLADIPSSGVDLPQSDDLTTLQASTDSVNAAIQKIVASGGTPTAGSLYTLASYDRLTHLDPNREKFVLLMTDGLPNCNPANQNNQCTTPNAACMCTLTTSGEGCDSPYACARGCTDQDASVDAILTLKDKGVQTFVVGFGADTGVGNAPNVLNAMALAGGQARGCPDGGDGACQADGDTSDSCDMASLTCKKKYYQADDGNALGAALKAIIERSVHPCTWKLEAAVQDPTLLSVKVADKVVAPGPDTWSYQTEASADGGVTSEVVFADSGAICQALKASTPDAPIQLDFSIVNPL